MIHRRSQDIVKQLSLGFSFPKSFPQRDIQSYTEKTTQSVFWTWAIMLILVSCSFLPLCLRLFFLEPLSVDPACCCAIIMLFLRLPVLGNDWVKIQLIRLLVPITHTHPWQPSALSSLTHSRRPLRSGLFQDLPTWALTWPAQTASTIQADAKLYNHASVYISLSAGMYHPVNVNPQEMVTKEFNSKDAHGSFFLIHFKSRGLL